MIFSFLPQCASATDTRRASRTEVIQKDNGACTYEDPLTGNICGARDQVERDHIIPKAEGGDDSLEDGRVLCRAHNQFMAEKILGKERANRWREEPVHEPP